MFNKMHAKSITVAMVPLGLLGPSCVFPGSGSINGAILLISTSFSRSMSPGISDIRWGEGSEPTPISIFSKRASGDVGRFWRRWRLPRLITTHNRPWRRDDRNDCSAGSNSKCEVEKQFEWEKPTCRFLSSAVSTPFCWFWRTGLPQGLPIRF